MSAFNPWHGFPSKNAVYLDRSFDLMRGSGQAAYGTFQTAYDAAAALAVSTGELVIIYVGQGTAAQFGNLTLAADYNSSVILVGLSRDLSKLGNIVASSLVSNGFAVNLKIANITIGTISTNAAEGFTAGAITVSGNGYESCFIGATTATFADLAPTTSQGGNISLSFLEYASVNAAAGGQCGAIAIANCKTTGATSNRNGTGGAGDGSPVTATDSVLTTVASGGNVTPGSISLTRCTGTTINTANENGSPVTLVDSAFTSISTLGATAGGAVSLTRSSLTSTIDSSGQGTNAGTVTLDQHSSCGNITAKAPSLSTVSILNGSSCGSLTFGDGGGNMSLTVRSSEIGPILNSAIDGDTAISIVNSIVTATGTNNCIQVVRSNGFNIDGSRLVTVGGNADTIGNFIDVSGTAQIKNSTLIQNGSGVPLGGAGASTIILANVVTKQSFNDSLFTVIGEWTSNPNFS